MDNKYWDDYFHRKSIKVLGLGAIITDDFRVINLISVFKEIAADQREADIKAVESKYDNRFRVNIFDEGFNNGIDVALDAIRAVEMGGEG